MFQNCRLGSLLSTSLFIILLLCRRFIQMLSYHSPHWIGICFITRGLQVPSPDWPPSCYLGSHTMYQHFINTIYRERNRHRHLNFSPVQLTALPRLLQLLHLQPYCWLRYWVLTNDFGYSHWGREEQRRRKLKHPYSCLINFVPIFYSR